MNNFISDILEKRPFWHWLVLLSLFGLLVRLPNLGRDALWLDEAISYLATNLTFQQHLTNQLQDPHPPFYYLLLGSWRQVVPDSDTALRGFSVLWGVALIPLSGQFALDLFNDKKIALLSAVMVSLSPFNLLYSHELRMYTLLMVLVTAGTWLYWRARQKDGWLWWGLFGVVWLTAVYTHLFAILALVAINLHALFEPDRRHVFPRLFLISVGLGLLFLPWGLTIFAETQQDLGSLRPLNQETMRNPIKPLTSVAFLLFGISSNLIYSGGAFFLCLAIMAVLLLESRRLRQEGTSSAWRLVLWQIGLVVGVPLLVYTIRPFFLPERTMAAASPFLILLLAWSIRRQQSPLPYLAGFSVLMMAIGAALYHTGPPLKPAFDSVAHYVEANYQAGDTVLHTSDGSYLPTLRYADFNPHWVLAGDPDPRKAVEVFELLGGSVATRGEVLAQNGRLWLIVALEHSVEWQQAQADFYDGELTAVSREEIGGMQIILYEVGK